MDKELIRYIIVHFPGLLTADEKRALKHIMARVKLCDDDLENSSRAKLFRRRGLLTDDPAVLDLLKDGYDMFEQRACERIMAEFPEKVFLNNCPQCNRLARTPYARQCRYCGYNWHDVVAAKFRLHSSFSITGRGFFLMGIITVGQVGKGQFLDLTMLGLVSKPKINSIEHVLKNASGPPTSYIALGTNELNEDEMNYLKKQEGFGASLDLLKVR